MQIYEIKKSGEEYMIFIFKNKNEKFQFVNYTKEKICKCEFDSVEDALKDLKKHVDDGKIKELIFIEDYKHVINSKKDLIIKIFGDTKNNFSSPSYNEIHYKF